MATIYRLGQFCGSVEKQRTVGDYVLTENVFLPGLFIPTHKHTHPHFTLVLEGRVTETYDDRELDCTALSLLLVPEKRPHSDRIGKDGARTFSVELSNDVASRLRDGAQVVQEPSSVQRGPGLSQAIALYKSFVEDRSPLQIEARILDVLSACEIPSKAPGEKRDWLAGAARRIEEASPIIPRLADLAREAGVHPNHLARAFRNRFGQSVGERGRQLRLAIAIRALQETNLPLGSIAQEAGYCAQSHFTHHFKRAIGVSPSSFRRHA
jgi:AraC family transcriptional regulator